MHKIVAYLKFGEASLNAPAVRHLNDDSLDNSWDNIALGTPADNAMDRSERDRSLHAQKAGKAASPHSDEKWASIREDYANGLGYKKLRKKYGVSLGSLSYQLSPKSRRNQFLKKI